MVSHALEVFQEAHSYRPDPASRFTAALRAAKAAFRADSGYAEEMAKAAVAVAAREHGAALRTLLSAGMSGAAASCAARRGQFTCSASAACGTGDCRFAAGVLSDLHVPAAPGRLPRPANHTGGGFSSAAALTALEQAVPYVTGVRLTSADCATAHERPAT